VSDQPNPAGLQDLLAQLETRQRHDPHDTLVRLAVRLRARDACEYCLLPAKGLFHVDHIIPPDLWIDYAAGDVPGLTPVPERRGPDHLDNLAWCCPFCNGSKARRVTARIGGQSQRLFDPRRDTWQEHFTFMHQYLFVIGVTPIGQATERVLAPNRPGLNGPLGTRHDAIVEGHYPPWWARGWLV